MPGELCKLGGCRIQHTALICKEAQSHGREGLCFLKPPGGSVHLLAFGTARPLVSLCLWVLTPFTVCLSLCLSVSCIYGVCE